jgi:hypothetical protein
MSLTFERVDEIFKAKFDLLSKTRKRNNYTLHSYYYEDRYIDTKKREVAREVCGLINGGVGGYIYVGRLPEYNDHPKRHKDGYLNIGYMNEQEFIEVTTKVTRQYK